MDCSLPGSSVHGISQTRILEWVAIPFSRRSSQPRIQTHISCIACISRQVLYHWATWEACYKQDWGLNLHPGLWAAVSKLVCTWELPVEIKKKKKKSQHPGGTPGQLNQSLETSLFCFALFFPFKASQIILICSKACEPLIWGLESADHVMLFSKTGICEFWQGLMWRNIRDIWPRLRHGAGYILCKPVHSRVSFRGIAIGTLNRGAFQMGFNTSRNQNVCIKGCFHHCAGKKKV